jgi:SPP1 gp7 family putative phage head morphogenesis protein
VTLAARFTFGDLQRILTAAAQVDRVVAEAERVAAETAERTGVADYFDVETADVFDVPPERAIAYFRAKGLRPTFSYADMLGAAHDQAFTVAKMLDVDMLGQVRASLESALANGTSFGEWKRELEPILKAGGWWGDREIVDPATGAKVPARLGSAWRLETIFRTNMQTAYAAQAWREIEEQADAAPFLMYDAVDDFRTRPLHASWDRRVLPVSSAWWKTHYPPNGYNCRCGVIQLSADQLADMGLSPTPAPEGGTYKWTNPRTGEVVRVPEGIDPGFDRNPGLSDAGDARALLREKVDVLPPSMQEAAKAAIRREFDTSHEAGRWHRESFDDAPTWVRDVVLDQQFVEVQAKARDGAWAQLGRLIDMDGKTKDTERGRSVWRHEFGHILDARIGMREQLLYVSQGRPFVLAMDADADRLVVAAGRGRKSKANDAKKAAVAKAYEDARERMVDAGRERRGAELLAMADAANVDLDAFLGVLERSTLILSGGRESIFEVGVAARVARMLEAIRLGDGEGFLRFASFKDSADAEFAAGQVQPETRRTVGESWRKDGMLASLSDLIGALTKNKVAGFDSGFPGHSTSYYRKAAWMAGTEAFANLTALAGHALPYWWELAKRFAPDVAAVYEETMREQL